MMHGRKNIKLIIFCRN